MIYIIMLLIVFMGAFYYAYKLLTKNIEDIKLLKKTLDIELNKRFKSYEDLIHKINEFLNYEQTILKDIIQFRTQSQSAKTKNDDLTQFAAESKISKVSKKIDLFFENYDEFKNDANLLSLKNELKEIESNINDIRIKYNEEVEKYQKAKHSFPLNIASIILPQKLDIKFYFWNSDK